MKRRILFDMMLLASIFYAPWWLTLVFVVVGVFKFPFYGEAILFGILIDLLYGTANSFCIGAIGLVLSVAVFIVMPSIKNAVRS